MYINGKSKDQHSRETRCLHGGGEPADPREEAENPKRQPGPGAGLPGAVHGHPRHLGRERRPALDPPRPGLQPVGAAVGGQRLRAGVRRLPDARRARCRPVRAAARLPGGHRAVHRGQPGRWAGTQPGDADRRPHRAGARRRDPVPGHPHDPDHHLLRPLAPRQGARGVERHGRSGRGRRSLDALGAVLVTGGLIALVYAIVGTDQHAWTSDRTLGTLAVAVVLLGWFVFHEARVATTPLMPLSLFRSRSVSGANVVMLCMGGGFFAMWYFLSLYMQNVLGYSPLKAGLAFVPMTLSIAAAAQVGSRLLPRTGARPLLLIGPLISAVALLWLSRITADGTYLRSLLGPSVLVTLGLGLAFAPVAFAATAGVPPEQAGLASGLLNTTRQVGGAIGLAALATVATTRSHAMLASATPPAALTAGYARALMAGAAIVALAAAASFLLPAPSRTPAAATAAPQPEPQDAI